MQIERTGKTLSHVPLLDTPANILLTHLPTKIGDCPTSRYFAPGAQHVLVHVANVHGHFGDPASKEVFRNSQRCVRAVLLELINQWGVHYIFNEALFFPENYIKILAKYLLSGSKEPSPDDLDLSPHKINTAMLGEWPLLIKCINHFHALLLEASYKLWSENFCILLPTQYISIHTYISISTKDRKSPHNIFFIFWLRERLSVAIAAAFSDHSKLSSQFILPMVYGGRHDFFGAVDDHNYHYHEYAPTFSLLTIDAMANCPHPTPHRPPPSARR